jgi:hypothetical protein
MNNNNHNKLTLLKNVCYTKNTKNITTIKILFNIYYYFYCNFYYLNVDFNSQIIDTIFSFIAKSEIILNYFYEIIYLKDKSFYEKKKKK